MHEDRLRGRLDELEEVVYLLVAGAEKERMPRGADMEWNDPDGRLLSCEGLVYSALFVLGSFVPFEIDYRAHAEICKASVRLGGGPL
jgi:hypothetical protein